MGRDILKITELNLDYAAGIRKLCDGNLKYFFDKYIREDIPAAEFYRAMKFMEPITPKIEQTIDEAYFEALADLGLTHDQLAEIPKYYQVQEQLLQKLIYLQSDTQALDSDELGYFIRCIKFYNHLMNEELISFKEKKKSKNL